VAVFLSSEWFDDLNSALESAAPVPHEDGAHPVRVVLEFSGAPSSVLHAITFTITAEGASLAPGDHLAADAIMRLSYADALALTKGEFDSATALRDGRVKVRGNVNAVVGLLGWLQSAHPNSGL
jgi:putative sterol carrier protein